MQFEDISFSLNGKVKKMLWKESTIFTQTVKCKTTFTYIRL